MSKGVQRLLAMFPPEQRRDPAVRARVQATWERIRAERMRKGNSLAGLESVQEWPSHAYGAGYRYAQNGGMPKARA